MGIRRAHGAHADCSTAELHDRGRDHQGSHASGPCRRFGLTSPFWSQLTNRRVLVVIYIHAGLNAMKTLGRRSWIISDGALILVRELDEHLGFDELSKQHWADPRGRTHGRSGSPYTAVWRHTETLLTPSGFPKIRRSGGSVLRKSGSEKQRLRPKPLTRFCRLNSRKFSTVKGSFFEPPGH